MTTCFQRSFFRPSLRERAGLPLSARSVGHYRVGPGFRDKVAVKHFVQVFWGVRGVGALVIQGVERHLRPGEVAVYFPGMEHRVYGLNETWEYRWWTMDGLLAVPIASAFGLLPAAAHRPGEMPVKLFENLTEAIQNVTPAGAYRAGAAAYELLTVAAGGCARLPADERIGVALRMMQEEWSNPLLGVGTLAQRLRMNRSLFSRVFHRAVGISPIEYLLNLRMQNALSRIKESRQPINEIARECGWREANYFARRVRQATGLAPREFRRQ